MTESTHSNDEEQELNRSTKALDAVREYLDEEVGNGAYLNSNDIAEGLEEYDPVQIGHALAILSDRHGGMFDVQRWSSPSTSPTRWYIERRIVADGGIE